MSEDKTLTLRFDIEAAEVFMCAISEAVEYFDTSDVVFDTAPIDVVEILREVGIAIGTKLEMIGEL